MGYNKNEIAGRMDFMVNEGPAPVVAFGPVAPLEPNVLDAEKIDALLEVLFAMNPNF